MQIAEIATASIPSEIKNARIERINLKIGKLSAVVPHSLRFCFEIATKDTPLSGAYLNIEEIPVEVHCNDCNGEWTINEPVFTCKHCKSGNVDMISGRELDITSIEIAEPE